MKSEFPPNRLVRGSKFVVVKYGVGDDSVTSFESSWMTNKEGIKYIHGTWGRDENKGRSSNYRELLNLVESMEEIEENDEMEGAEIFLFTGNTVAEATAHKGSSSSKLLFDLVIRLKNIEIK